MSCVHSTASGYRLSGLLDALCEGRHFEAAVEAVAKVFEGANSQLLGRLHKRREDVHRPSSSLTSAVQAHVASSCTHTSSQLRRVVVQWNFGDRQNR